MGRKAACAYEQRIAHHRHRRHQHNHPQGDAECEWAALRAAGGAVTAAAGDDGGAAVGHRRMAPQTRLRNGGKAKLAGGRRRAVALGGRCVRSMVPGTHTAIKQGLPRVMHTHPHPTHTRNTSHMISEALHAPEGLWGVTRCDVTLGGVAHTTGASLIVCDALRHFRTCV